MKLLSLGEEVQPPQPCRPCATAFVSLPRERRRRASTPREFLGDPTANSGRSVGAFAPFQLAQGSASQEFCDEASQCLLIGCKKPQKQSGARPACSACCAKAVERHRENGGRMDYDSCRSLPAMFFDQAARLGDKPFMWAKQEGVYQPTSWATAARDVRRLALGLRSLEIGRGDGVALVSESRPEWIIDDLAIMTAGAITVPAYVTHTVEDLRHLLADSGARAAIVSKPPLSARVLAAANQVDSVRAVIAIEWAGGQASAVDLFSWDDCL